jgi:hypothetical protein
LAVALPILRIQATSDERPDDCADAPEWIEANTALVEAYDELDKAVEAVLSTPPTTNAGVAGLLDYICRDLWEVAISVKSPDADLWAS